MEEMTLEELCAELRGDIEKLKIRVSHLTYHPDITDNEHDVPLSVNCLPLTRDANARVNLTLAFQGLENGRMRLGKTMQAMQGGKSILDK